MIPKILRFCFALLLYFGWLAPAARAMASGGDEFPSYTAVRTSTPPRIDGELDDAAWQTVPVATNFRQYSPVEGATVSQTTEVKIIFDDLAVYVGAHLHDTEPDSIAMELGARDAEELNADYFRFVIDPYNLRQDGYIFEVTSSGVQRDMRFTDPTFNAVWQSATRKLPDGWAVEMRIPYSAIRFPEKDKQVWALQLARSIRRNFEYDQWALVPRNAPNALNFFGTLHGIENISPPVRLSLMPYLSTYYGREPEPGGGYSNSFTYNYGADVKYGLDDRFTLDVTLLPDFGQVQSDNKVKNLGYSEVIFNENRTFFQEGVELFSLGNLFYTRRIGRIPRLYFSAGDMLNPGEALVENPSQARLLNATKLSGRTNNGLGIGIFNAITADMYAVAEDTAGNRRRILTEPLTNYNIAVFDQQLKNNSNVYLINTNVSRAHGWDDANVTGAGTTLNTKKNKFSFDGSFNFSQKFYLQDTANAGNLMIPGYQYFLGLRKNGGVWNYGVSHTVVQKNYYPRDMGFFTVTDYVNNRAYFTGTMNKPKWIFRQAQMNLMVNERTQRSTGKLSDLKFTLDSWAFLDNFFNIWVGGEVVPLSVYDYNEPRVEGMYYRQPEYWVFWAGGGTDERKKLMFSGNFTMANFFKNNRPGFPTPMGYFPDASVRFRMNNSFSITAKTNLNYDPYNGGFAGFDTLGMPVMGGRKVVTWVQSLSAKLVLNPRLSMTLTARHYWSNGHYYDYFSLGPDGELIERGDYHESHDFNYNAFNVDANLIWQFAPGSFLTVNYKNAIEKEESGFIAIPGYGENLRSTLAAPQTNTFSVKAIYYFDYLYLRKLKKKDVHS